MESSNPSLSSAMPRMEANAALVQFLVAGVSLQHLAFAGITVLLTCLLAYLYHRFLGKPGKIIRQLAAQGIPGYPLTPVVGQIPEYIGTVELRNSDPAFAAASHAVQFEMERTDKLGTAWYFSLGPQVTLCISDPSLVRQVYVTHNDNFIKDEFLRSLQVLGEGLLTSSGDAWRQQRRLINAAFNQREVRRIYATMVSCTDKALARAAAGVQSDPSASHDMHAFMSSLTLDIISRSAFGANLDNLLGPEVLEVLQGAIKEYLGGALDAFTVGVILPALKLLPLPINLRMGKLEQVVKSSMRRIIDARLQQYVKEKKEKESSNEEEQDGPVDLLQLMMGATQGLPHEGDNGSPRDYNDHVTQTLTQDVLMDNCITFLLAGHETTGNLLAWTVLLLSQHPEWQDKARDEVQALYRENGGKTPTYEQLSDLKVVGWVLHETLRLYPPAPLMGRRCVKETKVSETLTVPEGAEVWVLVAHMHRNKAYWGDDAHEFRPGRFKDGVTKACSPPSAFMPFSLGPRICIGQGFALVEAKVILAMLLHKFQWKVAPEYVHHPHLSITMHPKKGLPVQLTCLA